MENNAANKERRIYVDGVFDLIHWGHLNALRQSSELGGKIVVGVVSDEETKKTKGIAPIYTAKERATLIRGCRWVDEVIEDTPYDVSLDFLTNVAMCDIVAHGDDIAIGSSGKDCYEEPKRAGKLVHFRRSRGCSTSTTLGRLVEALTSDRFSHMASDEKGKAAWERFEHLLSVHDLEMAKEQYEDDGLHAMEADQPRKDMFVKFPRSRMSAALFSKFVPNTPRPPNAKVVYVDGSFDVIHVGHLKFLEKAKKMGDYLIVGLYDDQTVRTVKGNPFPVTHLMDRALTVLAMKYTDDVIMGAPFIPSKNYFETLGVSIVVVGDRSDDPLMTRVFEPHSVAKQMGILHKIDSGSTMTSMDIIERVSSRLSHIKDNIVKRCEKENNLYH